MSRLPVLALAYALLTACAAQAPIPVETPDNRAALEPEVTERAFPADSFYALLLAEFALRRQAYDVALDQYMEQAPLLRDAGVSEHTTNLTKFLQREDEALQAAQLWVELDPENPEANNTVAELLVRQKRTVEALPYLVTLEQHTGAANFPILLNGFAQLSDEQRAELVKGISAAAAEFPDNTRLLLTQALIHAENQQFGQALEDLDALLELEPDQPQALLLEARILKEQQARNPYARLEQALKDNPEDKMLRLQYASLLASSDMNAARIQLEILADQSPRDGDLLFSLALINREIGDHAAASAYLQQTIALGQRVDEAYYYLGRIAEDDDHPEQALTYYMKVEAGEQYFAACSRIGQILVTGEQEDRSHDWFKVQREKYPQLREQLYGLEADILARAGSMSSALQILNAALIETPDSTALRYARAMLNEEQDDLAGMERDLRAILAAEPDNATALNALGYTLADRTTRFDEALELISRALELQPNEPAILDSMGWVMFRTGNYQESVAYLKRAYADFPDAEVAAHLGEVLWANGETEDAIVVWQDALQRDPHSQVLLDTLDRLGVQLPTNIIPEKLP